MTYKTALITGGAIRIGKDICKKLHENGYNIICHYNKSENEAKDLKSELNQLRENSCEIFCLDLNDFEQVEELITKISNNFNSLDVLVNNASSFFKTDIENHDDSASVAPNPNIQAKRITIVKPKISLYIGETSLVETSIKAAGRVDPA